MKFEWDEKKRWRNIQKHAIDFAESVEMFGTPTLETLDSRQNYDEERWQMIGWMKRNLITLVYTERENSIRIISARKATQHEEAKYYRQFRP